MATHALHKLKTSWKKFCLNFFEVRVVFCHQKLCKIIVQFCRLDRLVRLFRLLYYFLAILKIFQAFIIQFVVMQINLYVKCINKKMLQRNKRKIWNGRDIAKICNNLITRCINHVFVKQSTKFKATCSKFKSAVENLISVCFRPFASKIL